jgi:CMP-N-acetylneuraminic acid synthetase
MRAIGIIPARSGSRGIPNKHLVLLAGKAVLAYTCEAARAAPCLDRVIISTDDEAIAACARRYGVEVPFLRPKALAQDETPMLDVLRHALTALGPGDESDAIVLLQPTSPLRRTVHIEDAVALCERSGADSVVSVVRAPHQFCPESLLRLEANRLVPYLEGPQVLRRQEKPALYARNGPAVLVTRRHVLEHGQLYGERCEALVMSKEESVDLDEPVDLAWAQWLLTQHRAGRVPQVADGGT